MFGYLQPFKDELKYKHIKEYKKYYCSVCNGLRREFGYVYSGLLNYEAVYLYLFLDGITNDRQTQKYPVRCSINPLINFEFDINEKLLKYVCFINYYLAVEKVKDNSLDEKNFLYRGLYAFLSSRKKYKKRCEEYYDLIKVLNEKMEVFNKLEKNSESSFDELALSMGCLLEIIVEFYLNRENIGTINERDRAKKVSFHLGELIYLLDALEDYDDDIKKNRYNPLRRSMSENPNEKRNIDLKRGMIMANLMLQKIQLLSGDIKYYVHEPFINNILVFSLRNSLKQIVLNKFDNIKERNANE